MSFRSFRTAGLAALTLAAAGTAQGTLFSFAANSNSNGYTFAGGAGAGGTFSIADFSRPNTYMLLVDDNNGPQPTVSMPVEFHAALTASGGQSNLIGGSLYHHVYHVSGSFGFYAMMGNPLLTVTVGSAAPGVLTVPGGAGSWSSSGAILGADAFADVTYTATQAFVTAMGGASNAAMYGIILGSSSNASSVGPDDFSFSLSTVNASSPGAPVVIDPVTKAPTTTWRCESSFSGSATGGIPAPGSAALLGLAGALILRRRRAG
jgi:uncharacterized protein (TIGR03382 family)